MASDNFKTLRIKPPVLGLDTEATPAYVNADHAAKLDNFLPTLPGRVALRGALSALPPCLVTATDVSGYVSVGNKVLSPVTYVAGATMRLDTVGTVTTTSTFAIAGRTSIMYGNPAEVDGYGYVCDSGSSGGICRWNGITGAANYVDLTNGPRSNPAAVCAHLGRLFAAGGSVPGTGAPAMPASLFWTDIGGTPTNVLGEWQDDISGLVNRIDLDKNTANEITGLGKVGRYMAIFRRNDIWMLYGDTSATFSTRRVVGGIGMAPRSRLLEVDEGIVFVSRNGVVYLFDGLSCTPIAPVWRTEAESLLFINSNPSLARINNEWFMVTATKPPAGSGITPDPFTRVCHLPSRSWYDFSTSTSVMQYAALSARPRLIGNTSSGIPIAYDGVISLYALTDLTSGQGIVNDMSGGYDLSSQAGDKKAIPGKYWTRVQVLGTPLQKALIKRVVVEYVYAVTSGAPTPGLTISLYDRQGNQLVAATAMTSSGSESVLRFTLQPYVEASDVQVRLEYNDTTSPNSAVVSVEIHDIWIEYQETRQSL